MKKLLSILLLGAFTLTLLTSSVFAKDDNLEFSSSTSGKTNKIKVQSLETDDDHPSKIEVDLKTKVSWKKNAKVIYAKDSTGEKHTVVLKGKDSDDFNMYVKGLKAGRSYRIKINGIKKRWTTQYKVLTIKFTIPKNTSSTPLKINEVSYDNEESKVEFEFNKPISINNNFVIEIKDENGNLVSNENSIYNTTDKDECDILLDNNLNYKSTYTYKISGVSQLGLNKYITLSGNFTAVDR